VSRAGGIPVVHGGEDVNWYHTHNSKHSPGGFPDLVIAGRWVKYVELKRQKENPTRAQREWIAALEAAGADVGVWRPADWLDGRVRWELARLAGRPRGAARLAENFPLTFAAPGGAA